MTDRDTTGRHRRSAGEELRIAVYGDGPDARVDVRIWRAAPDGEWYATRRGVRLRGPELDDLCAVLACLLGDADRVRGDHER